MKYADFLATMNGGRELCFSACFKSKTTQKAIASKDGIHGVMVFLDAKWSKSKQSTVDMSLDKDNKIVYWVRQ